MIQSWCEYHHTTDGSNDFLWYNSEIKIDKTPFLWKPALRRGLKYVHQLLIEGTTEFLPQEEVADMFGITTMQYNMLKSSIPKKYLSARNSNEVNQKLLNYIESKQKAKYVYSKIGRVSEKICQTEKKWEDECDMDEGDFNLAKAVKRINNTTYVVKLRSFQYRLLQRALITNVQLKRWKIIDSDNCTFCGMEKETVQHLLAYCQKCPHSGKKLGR